MHQSYLERRRVLAKTCGTKEDIKVLKDDVTQLIDCETKAKFDEVYKILSSTWSSSILAYFQKNVYHDLVQHSCKFVTSRFAVFKDEKVVSNNISESMNKLIKSITEHRQLPVDAIVMIFKQDIYCYDFKRGLTGFGNFILKPELEEAKKAVLMSN